MRYILVFIALFGCVFGYGQYPSSGVKQRLGYQTTGDGLIFRGAGTPAYTPTGLNNAWTFVDTTTGTIYNYYAGTWNALSTGASMPFDSVSFNTAYTSTFPTGTMAYDPGNETVSVGIDGGVTLQLGQELLYPVVINKTGTLIKNGTLVMVDTVQLVQGDHVRVRPAVNNGTIPSNYIMGVATSDIANDDTGLVTWFGYVREVKHADIAETGRTLDAGEILYPSALNAGRYTDVPPDKPAHHTTIALVVRKPSDNNMTLLVRPWLAPKLANLSDVNTSSVTGLSVLRYNSTTGNWEASATAGIVAADTAAMLNAYVRGLGTANQIAYWNGTRSVTGSTGLIWEDNFLKLKYAASSSQLFDMGRISFNDNDFIRVKGVYYTNQTNIYFSKKLSGTETNWLTTDHLGNVLLGMVGKTTNTTNTTYIGNTLEGVTTNTALEVIGGNGNNSNVTMSAIADYYNYNHGIILNATNAGVKNSNQLVIHPNGYIGIGRAAPSYTLDINATDGIRIPSGTTVQRPTGAAAVLRYNSDSLRVEYHTGTAWKGIAKTEELPVATSGFPRAAPVAVILSTYTVGATDAWIICDYAGTVTLTLPSAASYPGREIMVKTIRAQSVVSASSNVAPIDSNIAGTAILAATAGKWATLVSTGSQWIIMQSN